MKIAVDFFDNTLKAMYDDKTKNVRNDCYVVNLENEVLNSLVKKTKKGSWQQLKDEHGKLQWNTSSLLKPEMGFVVENQDTEINIKNHLTFWTIQEVLKIKYFHKLKIVGTTHVYFDELIDDDFCTKFSGSLNLGKKVLCGDGIIEHNFKLVNNKIVFDCEYENELPKLSISLDGKTFVKVDELPFERDFKKTTFEKVYLKISDLENKLTAYSFYFYGDSYVQEEFAGRGFLS